MALELEITTKKKVEDQFLHDIGCIALEGGIGYWSQIEGLKWEGKKFGTLHILTDWGEIDPDEDTHELTLELIGKGLKAILESDEIVHPDYQKDILKAVHEGNAGYIDAGLADVIVQAGCFGEIVYCG